MAIKLHCKENLALKKHRIHFTSKQIIIHYIKYTHHSDVDAML